MENELRNTVFSAIAILVVVLGFVLATYSVPAGSKGCEFSRSTGWNFQETNEGWHLKTPFVVEAYEMPFRTQTLGVHTSGEGETGVLTPKDVNGINFNADVTVRYQMDGDQICEFIQQKGTDVEAVLLTALRADSTRGVFGKYPQEEIPTKRIEIAQEVRSVLQNRLDSEASGNLKENFIIVEAVDIRNVQFAPRIEEAIVAKQERKQEAEKQTYILDQTLKEKEIRIVQAEALKESQILEAEGRARAILVEADAKAKGIQLVNDAYQSMPRQYVDVKYAEALQAVADGGNSVFMDLSRFDGGGNNYLGVMNYNELIAANIVSGGTK